MKFLQGSVILANVVWLHVNNCSKGAVACLYQEGGTTGITFCHQTDGPITGWAYKREGLSPRFYGMTRKQHIMHHFGQHDLS